MPRRLRESRRSRNSPRRGRRPRPVRPPPGPSRLIACFAARMVSGAFARSPRPVRRRPARRRRFGQPRHDPAAAASAASSKRAGDEQVLVRAGPMLDQARAVLDDRPLPSVRAIGTPKRAAGEHTRRSHASAIAQPAPAAMPSTWAIVGTATRSSRARHVSRRRSYSTPSSAGRERA